MTTHDYRKREPTGKHYLPRNAPTPLQDTNKCSLSLWHKGGDRMNNKMFIKKVMVEPKKPSVPVNYKKIIISVIFILLVAIVLIVISSFGKKVADRWDAIQFAYEKPAIIQAIRKDYIIKQTKLDQSYVASQSAEEQLINEVVQKIQAQSK